MFLPIYRINSFALRHFMTEILYQCDRIFELNGLLDDLYIEKTREREKMRRGHDTSPSFYDS